MTDDRRVRSAPAGDDEIPIDDDATSAPPPVTPKPESRIPADRPSQRRPETPSARRVRTRMTLRIPDDEVARPSPGPMPVAEPYDGPPIQATRIISVGPPPPSPDEPAASSEPATHPDPPSFTKHAAAQARPAPTELRGEREDSWTPYQPTVADNATTQRLIDVEATGEFVAPISEEILVTADVPDPAESGEPLDLDDAPRAPQPPPPPPPRDSAKMRSAPPAAPAPAPHAPAVASHAPAAASHASHAPAAASHAPLPPVAAAPHAPLPPVAAAPPVVVAHVAHDLPPPRPPMRALLHTDPDADDIRIEEDSAPVSEPTRRSEPGEAPEISADDLVSVESLPRAARPPTPPAGAAAVPLTRPKAKSIPSAPASNPPPPAVAPSPPVSVKVPAAPVVPPSPSSAPSLASLTGAAAAPLIPPPAPSSPQSVTYAAQSADGPRLIVPAMGIAPPPLTEAAAQRKRARPWWEELFNDDFIRTGGKITDAQIGAEATFIEESLGLAREEAVVLDLACGTGLHAIELTRRGYQVIGFDLSLAMLARAADEATDRGQKLNFVQGDMREMTFEDVFDGVYCWNTSFGYFEEDKNAQVIQRVHKALKPGGVLLLDVVNRDYIVRQAPSLAWFEGEGCVCMDEMSIDWITSRMKTKRTMMFDDGRTKEIEYSIRIYALHELGKILHDHGFKVAEVSGRTATPGVFFGCDSPRTLILAEKR